MTRKELKNKWEKEKDYYRSQEPGTGVHSFVEDCLESEELFSLKEGFLSSKPESRKNVYIHENKAKERRKADFVIYTNNSDIVIPLEAECFGKIDAGIKQLFNYQKDFDKKYGILTDGYTWRFYNNNIYREFNLNQILEETDNFLEFWSDYIKPESYYLSFFKPQGQRPILEKIEKLQVEENRQIFFDDITKLIKSFKNKLQVEGYFNDLDKKEKEKRAIEITYAYIIQFILYKTLVDNEFSDFFDEFSDIVEEIYCCLKVKQYGKILAIIEGISNKISQNIYRPYRKEQDFINQILINLIRKPKNELHEVAPWLDIFVFIKKYNFANIQKEIFGYIYENYLKELYEEEKKGQYFTDPAVVNFMLQQVGFTPEEIRKQYQFDRNSISLIDPSCGSGTFLYSAVDSIIKAFGNNSQEKSEQIEETVNNNVFGLDIAEFPLYLAEMNILMRMLPLIINEKYNNPIDKKIKVFLTKDSVSEFMDTALRNTVHDIDVKGGQLSIGFEDLDLGYTSYVREGSDLEEMKRSLENQPEIPRRRFDFVIGNPPYIGYNECSKQGVLITKLIQEKKVKMSNIYGVNLNTVPGRIKAYAPKPNLYAFFVALGIALLKDNGRLCYIIPQTLLTAADLDVLRYHLAKFTTIEKIITFSGKMFIGRGLRQDKPVATSSLILVISKEIPPQLHQLEIINYENPNDDIEKTLQNILIGKKIKRKRLLQNKLLQSTGNWNFIKRDKQTLEFLENYKRNETFDIYRIPASSMPKFDSVFYFDKGLVFPKNKIQSKSKLPQDTNCFHLIIPEKNRYHLVLSDTVIRASDIRFPKGSQGIEVYEKKYKVVWRYMNTDKFYFSDQRIMLNFNWVLISSDNKRETLYIFSLLNSPVNKIVFQSLLRSENEKDILIGIKAIKEFVRVPKITKDNQRIKDEIIRQTEEMLALDDKTLSGFMDFSRVMIQKFDNVSVEDGFLVLENDNKKVKLPIKENSGLVKKTLEERYGSQGLGLEDQKISIFGLKALPVIDFERQKALKGYIDDLVFSLYFNIPLKDLGINRTEEIKRICQKYPYYELITEEQNRKA